MFRLDASNLVLSFKELSALLETYTGQAIDPESCISSLCIIDVDDRIFKKVVARAGYIKEAGQLIAIGDLSDPAKDIFIDQNPIEAGRYTIKYIRLSSFIIDISQDYLRNMIIRKIGIIPDRRGQRIVLSYIVNNLVITVVLNYIRRAKNYEYRAPSKRPFFRSIALPVRLSRALINLTRLKEGEKILDPFAGTGSILLEAYHMGLKSIGVELDWKISHGCITNLKHYHVPAPLLLADSTELELQDIDGIATDPPYGRAASTHGKESFSIYRRFIEKASEWLRRRGYLVFMSPTYFNEHIDEALCSYGLILCDKIYMYVHGGLTRTIYVVEKP